MTLQASVCCAGAERALRKESAASGEQDTGRDIGERNHLATSDNVKQPAEKERPEEIPGRERHDVPTDVVRADAVEFNQYQRISEENGIVEKRLSDHQAQADQRSAAVPME